MKAEADAINSRMVEQLPGVTKFLGAKGDLRRADLKQAGVEEKLVEKKNMRVMALRKDSKDRYQNGSF